MYLLYQKVSTRNVRWRCYSSKDTHWPLWYIYQKEMCLRYSNVCVYLTTRRVADYLDTSVKKRCVYDIEMSVSIWQRDVLLTIDISVKKIFMFCAQGSNKECVMCVYDIHIIHQKRPIKETHGICVVDKIRYSNVSVYLRTRRVADFGLAADIYV